MQKGRLIGVTLLFAGLVSRFAFGVGVVSARETDRLSTAAFSEPPLHVRPGSFWDWLNGDSLRPEATRFTRTNLDGIRTDPTMERSYRSNSDKSRAANTELPPLMKSGLFGPVKIITPKDN